MSVHTPVAPSPATTTHDCGCGCGGRCGCETRCCDLECLVRPNFFCGQLLTDADLTAVVEWTRRRLVLSRYRDGWGIACGLHVSCAPLGGRAGCCDPADGPVRLRESGLCGGLLRQRPGGLRTAAGGSRRCLPPGGRPVRAAEARRAWRHQAGFDAPDFGAHRRQGLLGSPEGRRLRRRPVAALPRGSQPRTAGPLGTMRRRQRLRVRPGPRTPVRACRAGESPAGPAATRARPRQAVQGRPGQGAQRDRRGAEGRRPRRPRVSAKASAGSLVLRGRSAVLPHRPRGRRRPRRPGDPRRAGAAAVLAVLRLVPAAARLRLLELPARYRRAAGAGLPAPIGGRPADLLGAVHR